MRDTIESMPRMTIVPPDTGGARAIELLHQLAHSSPTASLQLRTGEVIGEGGMGVVRLAEQVALGRTVAVKTLKPGRRDPTAALDLLREAWVTGSIEHPNVVPVHYIGVDADSSPLIVLKRIEGVEWSALARDDEAVARKFGATDLLAWNLGILMQVLDALRFAHHRGVVHRDLKPANVMIGDFGEVYLLDWGIAVSLRDDGSGRLPLAVNATTIAGTPCYMAPEMLGRDDGPRISERTDVYLAGSVLFELITGAPPHQGKTALEVIASVINGKPVLPATVPAELARICAQAMHDDPSQRFDSALALRRALQAYLEHRGSALLVERARERLDQLLAALAAPTIDRENIYRLFGACRFGFHEALAAWRDNADARAGLVRATIAVAEYELAADNPAPAVALLTELDEPPPLLATARAAVAARADRTAELEKLRAAHDPLVGRRTRSFLVLMIGCTLTIVPLVLALQRDSLWFDYPNLIEWSLGCAAVIAAVVWWGWASLGSTLFNRRLVAAAVFVFLIQALLAAGMYAAGVPVETTQIAMPFLWGTCVGMLAITIDPWLAISAATYYAAFVIATRWRGGQMYMAAASNLVFTITAVVRWRPDTWKMSAEDRAWLESRKRR